MFKNKKIETTYIQFKQLKYWIPIVLKRAFGYDYNVYVSPVIHKNMIGLNIDETTMTEESYEILKEYFNHNYFTISDCLLGDILELSRNRKNRRHDYKYKYFIDDLDGFYLIRERI